MEITIDHHGGQYPSFNIKLHGTPGAEPFLEIKGCRIVQGQNGPFISYPSRKMENGKYWNHVYGGEKFNETVLVKAMQTSKPAAPRPAPSPASPSNQRPRASGSGFDDMDDDIQF